jgi:quercetin dioxygenase-like cupin family protein
VTISDKSAAIVRQNDARVLGAFGLEITILLDGARTGGALTMWTGITPPGGGPPPRYHLNAEELFYVISGCVGFLVNDSWHEVGPGGMHLCRGAWFTRSRMSAISTRAC